MFMSAIRSVAALAWLVSAPAIAEFSRYRASGGRARHVSGGSCTGRERHTRPGALVALNDMRALMRKQPGYISEEFLQNPNAGNVPRDVHVFRWASMTDWSGLFRAPEFSQLSAHGNQHFSIAVGAFQKGESIRFGAICSPTRAAGKPQRR